MPGNVGIEYQKHAIGIFLGGWPGVFIALVAGHIPYFDWRPCSICFDYSTTNCRATIVFQRVGLARQKRRNRRLV